MEFITTILTLMAENNFDYYFSNLFLMFIGYINRDKIDQAAKGGNGVYQWPEILQVACLLMLMMYTLRVIFIGIEAEAIVYGSLLAGAGIGVTATLVDKKIKDK